MKNISQAEIRKFVLNQQHLTSSLGTRKDETAVYIF